MTSKQEKSAAVVLLQLAVTLGSIPVGAYIQAWAIKTIWNWHAVSVLGLPALGMWTAFGLSCLFSAFMLSSVALPNSKDEEWGTIMARIVGKWLGYGLLTWLAYLAT